jgi:rhodanese-related sulfurtransferase
VALQLKKQGITRIRPLAGGISGWRELQFPVDPVPLDERPLTVA